MATSQPNSIDLQFSDMNSHTTYLNTDFIVPLILMIYFIIVYLLRINQIRLTLIINFMEYRALQQKLAKPTRLWTVTDIEIWLKHLNMQVLYPRFRENSVDGSCIQQLTVDDLRNELGIESSITIRKLMKWITQGFVIFNEQVKNSGKKANSIIEKRKINQQIQSIQSTQVSHQITITKRLYINDKRMGQNIEVVSFPFKIGSSAYQCAIFFQGKGPIERDIDSVHALITRNQSQYFIKDNNTYSGTFMKIVEPIKLYSHTELEINSATFFVDVFDNTLILSSDTHGVKMYVRDHESIYAAYPSSPKLKIGGQLPHSSWIKVCSFVKKQGNYSLVPYIKNCQLFLRIPSSKSILIKDNSLFKIGGYQIQMNLFDQCYTMDTGNWLMSHRFLKSNTKHRKYSDEGFDSPAIKATQNKSKCGYSLSGLSNRFGFFENEEILNDNLIDEQLCVVCYQIPRNCLLMDCKHYVICLQCSKGLVVCPICRKKITEIERVYTNP